MNITYFMGNGFDLALGLKSSFKDFYICLKKEFDHKGNSTLEEAYINNFGLLKENKLLYQMIQSH